MGQEMWNKLFAKHLSHLDDIGDSSKSGKKKAKASAAAPEVSAEAIREMLSTEDGVKQLTELVGDNPKKQKAVRAMLAARNKAWAEDFDLAIAGQAKAGKLNSGYEGPDAPSLAGDGATAEDRLLSSVENVEERATRKNLDRGGPFDVRANVRGEKSGELRSQYTDEEVMPPIIEASKRQDDIVGLGDEDLPADMTPAKSPDRKYPKTITIGGQDFYVKGRGDARSRFDNMPKPTRSKKGPDGKVMRDADGNPIEEPQTLMQQKGISDKQLSMSRDQFVEDVKGFLSRAKPRKADGSAYKLDEVLGMTPQQLREFAMQHPGGGDLFSLTHFNGQMKKGHEPGSPKGQESAVNKSMVSGERLQHETARRAAGTDPAAQRGRTVSEEEAIEGGIPLTALPQTAFGRQSASAVTRIGDGIDALDGAFGRAQAMQIRAALAKLPEDEAFTKAFELAEVINTRGLSNTERTTPRADIDAKFGTASAILAGVGHEMGALPKGIAAKANKATRATGGTASNPPAQPSPVQQAPLGEHWRHDWQQAEGPAVNPSADPQPSVMPERGSPQGTDVGTTERPVTKPLPPITERTPVRSKFDPKPVKQRVPSPTADDIGGDNSYLLGKQGETQVGLPDDEPVITTAPRKRGKAAKAEAAPAPAATAPEAAPAPAPTTPNGKPRGFKQEYEDLLARANASDGSDIGQLSAEFRDIRTRQTRFDGYGTSAEAEALAETVAEKLDSIAPRPGKKAAATTPAVATPDATPAAPVAEPAAPAAPKTPVRRGRKAAAAVVESAPSDVTARPVEAEQAPQEWALDGESFVDDPADKIKTETPATARAGFDGTDVYEGDEIPHWGEHSDISGVGAHSDISHMGDATDISRVGDATDLTGTGRSSAVDLRNQGNHSKWAPQPATAAKATPSSLGDSLTPNQRRFLMAAVPATGLAAMLAMRGGGSQSGANGDVGGVVAPPSGPTAGGAAGFSDAELDVAAAAGKQLDRIRQARDSMQGMPGFMYRDTRGM